MEGLRTFLGKCKTSAVGRARAALGVVEAVGYYAFANTMVGGYRGFKPKANRVNVYDYHPELEPYGKDCRYNDSRYNLGDSLWFPIVNWMLGKWGLNLDSPTGRTRFLFCVGSGLLGALQHNATVWGSGVLHEPIWPHPCFFKYPFMKFDIRAVRGPMSREMMLRFGHRCPEVYGDPAVLMPLIYKPELPKVRDLLVIPQFVTEKQFRQDHPQYEIVSMNTNDYRQVIDQIVSSRLVVTSSLHGVILSDAYGVPSVLFRGLDKICDFKYLDYYCSTGRCDVHIADSFEEALTRSPLPLPDLSKMQKDLIDSFPIDLWNPNLYSLLSNLYFSSHGFL